MRVVELLGIPGSGKSTVSSHLIKELNREQVNAMSLSQAVSSAMSTGVGDRWVDPLLRITPSGIRLRFADRLFFRSKASFQYLAAFMQQHPEVAGAVFSAQARRADHEMRPDLVIGWFLHMVARYQLATSTLDPDAVLVMDEGFVQRSVLLFGHRFGVSDHDDADRYVAGIPEPTLLIRLVVSPQIASERLLADGRTATRRLDGNTNDNMRFLNDADACCAYVADRAREAGLTVIEVDASGDLGELLAATSAETIRRLRHP